MLSLHPFLIAVYPVLFLFSKNLKIVKISEIYLPLAFVLSISLFLIIFFKIILKNCIKASVITSVFLILFFSFGHVADEINKLSLMQFSITSLGILLILSIIFLNNYKNVRDKNFLNPIILLVLASIIIILYTYSIDIISKLIGIEILKISRDTVLLISSAVLFTNIFINVTQKKNISFFNSTLNLIASTLVLTLILTGSFQIYRVKFNKNKIKVNVTLNANVIRDRPDIYYIILDAYGRSDVLREMYGYDNKEFIKFLEDNKFFVVKNGRSNYSQTELSLSSSLNMDYLQNILRDVDKDIDDRKILYDLIQNNKVLRSLKENGYNFISVSSGDSNTESLDADLYLKDSNSYLSEFSNALIATTIIPSLPLISVRNIQYQLHRNRVNYAFSAPDLIGSRNDPFFAFIHIISPHPPFIFNEDFSAINPSVPYSFADGSYFMKTNSRSAYINGYKKQTDFVSKKTEEMVKKILLASGESVIIIIQGDHGPGAFLDQDNILNSDPKERMSIINAIRAPKLNIQNLDEKMTPVNTFRHIFNVYFGTHYEILQDRIYMSSYPKPYVFYDVTNQVSK